MKIFGAILGFLLIAGLFVLWIRAYKSIKGDATGGSFGSSSSAEGKKPESLEAFIAAYRRGEVKVDSARPSAPTAAAATDSAMAPPPPAAAKREPFLSGQVKLGYYLCKSGLRDHHVFVHVQIGTLYSSGAPDPAISRATVDLLVCNAQLSAVAAIDLIVPGTPQPDPAKSDSLKSLGIRYLRLSTKSLPKPEELHTLLYRM